MRRDSYAGEERRRLTLREVSVSVTTLLTVIGMLAGGASAWYGLNERVVKLAAEVEAGRAHRVRIETQFQRALGEMQRRQAAERREVRETLIKLDDKVTRLMEHLMRSDRQAWGTGR